MLAVKAKYIFVSQFTITLCFYHFEAEFSLQMGAHGGDNLWFWSTQGVFQPTYDNLITSHYDTTSQAIVRKSTTHPVTYIVVQNM